MGSPSKHSLFLAALQTRLGGVVAGAGFWNTLAAPTGAVVRTPAFADRFLDASLVAIVFLIPNTDSPGLATFGRMRSSLRVDLLLAKRYEGGDSPFDTPSPDRWEEQDRIRQDVMKRIEQDPKVGGTCDDCQITDVELNADETYAPTWALVAMSLRASLQYDEGAP